MKILTNQIFFIIFLVCSSSIIQAQNVDEIIDLHIKAHGNIEKWESIESMKITGRFTAFSEEEDIFIIKTDDGKYYSDLNLGQFKVKEAFNGQTGWTIDPWHEILFPRKLNKAELNVFEQKAEFFTPFYKYKEKGHEVELIGKQNVDGIDVYVIKLTRPSGKTETWFLDANTYLEYKYESDWVDFTYPSPAESYFEDFRTVDGVVIPFFIERTFSQRDRVLQIEDIEFNPKVDESKFDMPRSEEIKKLAFLVGNWDVKFDVRTRSGSWYNYDNTVSTIEFVATNMIEEKIQYDRMMVQSKIIDYTFNSTTKKYRIIVFYGHSSDIEAYEGNFTDSTFTVENTFVSYSDSIKGESFSKIIFSDMENDSFVVKLERSRDKGETWNVTDRFTYNRRKE